MEENRKPRPQLALPSRRENIAGWIYLPFYLFLVEFGLAFVFMALGRDISLPRNQAYLVAVKGGIHLIALVILFRRYLGRSLRRAEEFPGRFLAAIAVGLGIYFIGTALISMLIALIAPDFENVNDNSIVALSGYGQTLLVIYAVVMAPPVEELLFRGLIFGSIRPRSRVLAYCVSMAAFSVLHVVGYVLSYPPQVLALCFLQYLPAAFGLAWAMEHSGSICASMAVHILANAAAMRALVLE